VARDHPTEFNNAIQEFLNSINIPTLVTSLLTAIQSAVTTLSNPSTITPPTLDVAEQATCTLCTNLVTALYAAFKINYKVVEIALIQLCVNVQKIQQPSVNRDEQCNFVTIQGPEINKTVLAADPLGLRGPTFYTICAFQNACFKQPSATNVLMTPRCNPKPKPTEEELQALEVKKQDAFKIVQLTDIHIEPEYDVGSNANCGLMVCCLDRQGPGTAGPYGDYRCNVPVGTAAIVARKMAELQADMHLFTGDVAPHRAWNETEKSQYDCIRGVAKILREALPSKTIITCLGNHDNYPTNLNSMKFSKYTPAMLDVYLQEWQQVNGFDASQINTMRTGGFYTMLRPFNGRKNFRIIATNSNYHYTLNFWNPLNHKQSDEVAKMKNLLETTLKNSCDSGTELVILLIHHSIGDIDFVETEAIYYQNLIVKYAACIKLVISGHSHIDEFRLIKDISNELKSIVFISGSVDTSDYKNPALRTFYFDRDTEELLDIDQYHLNLQKLPADGDPVVELEYSTRREYGMADMSPASFEDLLCRFETEPDLLQKHLNHGTADAVITPGACNGTCLTNHQCRQLHALNRHYSRCSGTSQEYYFYALDVAAVPPVLVR